VTADNVCASFPFGVPKFSNRLNTAMRHYIAAFKGDWKRYRERRESESMSACRWIELCLKDFGLHCVVVYRFCQCARWLRKKNRLLALPLTIPAAVTELMMRLLHHVQIDAEEIGPGFTIYHTGTIYIGARSIGRNFSVTHNVTIGIGQARGKTGTPLIGDNVWVGTGAVVYGEITIGNNVTIAPGCILSADVPDGFLAAGNPGRPLIKDYDNTLLFKKCVRDEETGNGGKAEDRGKKS
jgi:serine O-acetyltransferase